MGFRTRNRQRALDLHKQPEETKAVFAARTAKPKKSRKKKVDDHATVIVDKEHGKAVVDTYDHD